MSKFIFNTARPYQPQGHRYAGQVIEVELVEGFGNIIKYRDLSRGLDGAFYYVHTGLPQSAIARTVMEFYDHNRAKPIDQFEHEQREALEETFYFTRGTHDGLWYYRPWGAGNEDESWTGGFNHKQQAYMHALAHQ